MALPLSGQRASLPNSLQELVVVFARLLHEETGIVIMHWFVDGYGLHTVSTGTRMDHYEPILNNDWKCPMTASQWLLETF